MNAMRWMMAAGLLAAMNAAASEVQIGGGQLWVGSELRSEAVRVDADGALGGTGLVAAGQVDLAGSVMPGSTPGARGVLSFSSNLTFQAGSLYECDIATSTSVDRLNVGGVVAGPGTVRVANPSGTIPVDQIIIDGGASSDYDSFLTADPGATNWGLAENPATDLALTRLDGDTDGNGLPDWWELLYFGQRTGTDPDGQSDADEVPNGQEYAAGTIPTDGDSYLRLTWLEKQASGAMRMGWPTVGSVWLNIAAPDYKVEATTNITSDGFAALSGDLAPTPPENVYTNPTPPDFRLYRVTRN